MRYYPDLSNKLRDCITVFDTEVLKQTVLGIQDTSRHQVLCMCSCHFHFMRKCFVFLFYWIFNNWILLHLFYDLMSNTEYMANVCRTRQLKGLKISPLKA